MNPNDIVRSDFTSDVRGFSRNEVQNHLMMVAQLVEDKQRSLDELTNEVTVLHASLQDVNDQLQQAAHDRELLDAHIARAQSERDEALAELAIAKTGHPDVYGTQDPEEISRIVVLTTRLEESESALGRAHDRIAELETQSDDQVVAEALARAKRAEAIAKDAMESEQLLKRTLVMAQRTADITVAEARSQAASVRRDADAYADKVTQDAQAEAKQLHEEAEDYSLTVRSQADAQAQATTQSAKDEAAFLTERAHKEADTAIADARAEAARRIQDASSEAHEMREASQDVLRQAVKQARAIAELRRTYSAQARAAIEGHVAQFSALATLPELPEDLQTFLDAQY